MSETDIRRIVRDEIMTTMRPILLALKQGNGQVNGAVNKMLELERKK